MYLFAVNLLSSTEWLDGCCFVEEETVKLHSVTPTDYRINFILSLGNMKSDFVGVKFAKHCACKIELTKIWT